MLSSVLHRDGAEYGDERRGGSGGAGGGGFNAVVGVDGGAARPKTKSLKRTLSVNGEAAAALGLCLGCVVCVGCCCRVSAPVNRIVCLSGVGGAEGAGDRVV
jgi:hypothetical protein